MKVTEQEVAYVAELAHLELTEAEKLSLQKDLSDILGYVDTLNELDTTGVEPLAEVASKFTEAGKTGSARFDFVLRADVAQPSLAHDVALRGAPENDGVSFKVAKVIEK